MDYRSGGTKLSCSLQKSSILHVWIESTWEPIKLTFLKILFWFPFHRSEITVMLRVLFCPFFVWEEKVGAGLQKSHSRLKRVCVRARACLRVCEVGAYTARAEPPRSWGSMRREGAAFLISLNAIDSHLASTVRPPTDLPRQKHITCVWVGRGGCKCAHYKKLFWSIAKHSADYWEEEMLIFEQCLHSQCAPACEGMSCVSAPSSRPSLLLRVAQKWQLIVTPPHSSVSVWNAARRSSRGIRLEVAPLSWCVRFFAVVQVWLCIFFFFSPLTNTTHKTLENHRASQPVPPLSGMLVLDL